jgi:hypothetical protein
MHTAPVATWWLRLSWSLSKGKKVRMAYMIQVLGGYDHFGWLYMGEPLRHKKEACLL